MQSPCLKFNKKNFSEKDNGTRFRPTQNNFTDHVVKAWIISKKSFCNAFFAHVVYIIESVIELEL